jgi:hypothetical protein
MEKFKFHYVYRVTSLIENKHYYGSRSSILHPKEDLGIKYFTSSTDKDFVNNFKQNPKQFKLKIVSIFNNREDALLFEIKLHNKFEVAKNSKFYNRCKQTVSGWTTIGLKLKPMSDEIKAKLRNKQTGKKHTPESKLKMSNSAKNRLVHPSFGKKHTKETKLKIKESLNGKNLTEERKLNISNGLKGVLKGIPQKKVECPYCNKIGGASNMKRWHLERCKFKLNC